VTFTLRPATPQDADWLFAIRRETMRGYVEAAFGYWDDAAQRDRFDESDELNNMQVIVADGRDVGLLEVERGPRDIFLANIQIGFPGQNRGVGTAVIRALMAEAREARKPLRLQVLKVNRAARRLYDRLGFVVADDNGSHTRMIWTPPAGS
jgi:ribosomal protein S18 acetylase RimI-like enzyme